jgi:membrane protein required for colicin V production
MSILDWIFTGFIILLAVRCFAKGFVEEILAVASWIGGLASALLFSNALSSYAAKNFTAIKLSSTVLYVLAFIVCFLLGFLVVKLIEKLVSEGLEAAHLEVFNKLLGLVLGIAEGLAIVSLILIIMEIQPFFNVQKILSSSMYAKTLLPLLGPTIDNTIKPALTGSKPSVKPLTTVPGKK